MASGKKGKKTKGKTLALTDFLQETGVSLPTQPIRRSTTSWADEVDEYDGSDSRKVVNVVLPTGPKASRDVDDIADKVPKDPPYVAYLSNLPYDLNEEDISDFFGNLRVSNMRIPKDERPGEPPKLKGYGYIEFEDRESLIKALAMPDPTLRSRRIRIEISGNSDNDRRRGGRMDMNRSDREMSDTTGDWRSGNRPEPVDDRRRGGPGSGGGGGFTREGMRDNRDRDGGFSRDRDFGRDRDGGGFGRNRDREQDDRPGGWRDGDRPNRDDNRGFSRSNFRDSDRDRGRGFDDRDDRRGGDRDNRRGGDRDDRRGGGFGRRYEDREDTNGGITRSGIRTEDRNGGDQEERTNETRQRPKLNLAPRTKPIEPVVVKEEEVQKEEEKRPTPVPAASIFGAAKPVDTAQREREIEEKLRKEQDERLRDSSKDRKDKSGDEGEKSRTTERSRPIVRREDSGPREYGARENKDLPPRERKNDDYRRPSQPGDRQNIDKDHVSPPPDKRKTDRQEKEEKRRERPEREMPKLKETDVPVFSDSNKFAFLQDEDIDD